MGANKGIVRTQRRDTEPIYKFKKHFLAGMKSVHIAF